jgi:hypothetical protein
VEALFRNYNPVPLKNVSVYAWTVDQAYPFSPSFIKTPIAPGETITYTQRIDYGSLPVYVVGMGSVDP